MLSLIISIHLHRSFATIYLSFFSKGVLEPVTNITSSINSCSSIHVTWNCSKADDGIRALYYILNVYDNVTGTLMNTFKANNNSYQFEDEDLFTHHYTYIVTGVNQLGEGISNSATFSYQRGIINSKYNYSNTFLFSSSIC